MRNRWKSTVFEILEPRLFLDGDVTATLAGGVLRITGDANNNTVYVNQVGTNQYVVSDFDGTTNFIGGEGQSIFLEGPLNHVRIDLTQGGNDRVHVGVNDIGDGFAGSEHFSIPRTLTIQTGTGDDYVEVVAGGEGGPGVIQQTIVIGGRVKIDTDAGADHVTVGAEGGYNDVSLDVGGPVIIDTGTNQPGGDTVDIFSIGGEGSLEGPVPVGGNAAVALGRNVSIKTRAENSHISVGAIGGSGIDGAGGDATLDIAGSLNIRTGVPLPDGEEPGNHAVDIFSIGGEGATNFSAIGVGGSARLTIGRNLRTRITGGRAEGMVMSWGGIGIEGAGGAANLDVGGSLVFNTDNFDNGLFVSSEGGDGVDGVGGDAALEVGRRLNLRGGNGNDNLYVGANGGHGNGGVGGSANTIIGGPVTIVSGHSPIEENTDYVNLLAAGGGGNGIGGYANLTIDSNVFIRTGSGRSRVSVGAEGGDEDFSGGDGGHAAMEIHGNLRVRGGSNRDEALGGEGNTVTIFGRGGEGMTGDTGGNGGLDVSGGVNVSLQGPDVNTVRVQAGGGSSDGGTGGEGIATIGTDVRVFTGVGEDNVRIGAEGGHSGDGNGQGGAAMMSVGRNVIVGTRSNGDDVMVGAEGGSANSGNGGDAEMIVGRNVMVYVGRGPNDEPEIPNGERGREPGADTAGVSAEGGFDWGGNGGWAGLNVVGNVLMKGGSGINPEFYLAAIGGEEQGPAHAAIGGSATIITRGTDAEVNVVGIRDVGPASIGGNLFIKTGNGDDRVVIFDSHIVGNVVIKTSRGNDEVTVEDTHVLGNVGIGTGTGNDLLGIVGTEIGGFLKVLLYYGNDWFYVENTVAGTGFASGSAGFDTLETDDPALPPWTFLSFEDQIVGIPVQ